MRSLFLTPSLLTGATALATLALDARSAGMGIGRDLAYVESHEGKLIDAKGAKGQFVRVFTNGNTTDETNHYTEVGIWGKPAP